MLMIACTVCDEWYHLECIGMSVERMNRIKKFICDQCKPPSLKRPKLDNTILQTSDDSCLCCKKRPACIGSLFCSNECHMTYSIEQLKDYQKNLKHNREQDIENRTAQSYTRAMDIIQEELASGKILSLPEQEDLNQINHIKSQYDELKKSREVLSEEKAVLEKAIENARRSDEINETDDSSLRVKKRTQEAIDCFGCGEPFSMAVYAKHSTTCFVKLETQEVTGSGPTDSRDVHLSNILHCDHYDSSTKTYCKKLKASCAWHCEFAAAKSKKKTDNVLMCGCPLSSGSYCRVPRSTCLKHLDWENIKRANIMLTELNFMQTEKKTQR